MEFLGYLSSILIGISLGMIGGGGSVLTVPVLVYLMNINPLLATASSLFIVGITSLVGGLRAYSGGIVDIKAVAAFSIPSTVSIFIARHFILPALPDIFFRYGQFTLTKGMFLMTLFAVLMFAVFFTMTRNKKSQTGSATCAKQSNRSLLFNLGGLIVGIITGLLGAGGGFLIIPILVLYLGLPMKTAVGTSLLIIAVNSLFGFIFSVTQFEFDWTLLASFSLLAISGVFIGSRIANKFSAGVLKKVFAWFVLLIGIYIIVKETFLR